MRIDCQHVKMRSSEHFQEENTIVRWKIMRAQSKVQAKEIWRKEWGFYTEVVREREGQIQRQTESLGRASVREYWLACATPFQPPLCSWVWHCGTWKDSVHITQHTTQSSRGSQKCPTQGSGNYDNFSLQLCTAQELRIVFTFLKCCKASKQTLTKKKTILQRPSIPSPQSLKELLSGPL